MSGKAGRVTSLSLHITYLKQSPLIERLRENAPWWLYLSTWIHVAAEATKDFVSKTERLSYRRKQGHDSLRSQLHIKKARLHKMHVTYEIRTKS